MCLSCISLVLYKLSANVLTQLYNVSAQKLYGMDIRCISGIFYSHIMLFILIEHIIKVHHLLQ